MVALSNGFLTPDAFRLDWYSYLTNQLSHMVLGLFLVIVWCSTGVVIDGEFPQKEVMFLGILSAYAFFEIYQGGDWADSLEDTIYVVLWGAGLPLLAFDWVSASQFTGDLSRLYPWVLFLAVQIFLGCWFRYRLAKQMQSLDNSR